MRSRRSIDISFWKSFFSHTFNVIQLNCWPIFDNLWPKWFFLFIMFSWRKDFFQNELNLFKNTTPCELLHIISYIFLSYFFVVTWQTVFRCLGLCITNWNIWPKGMKKKCATNSLWALSNEHKKKKKIDFQFDKLESHATLPSDTSFYCCCRILLNVLWIEKSKRKASCSPEISHKYTYPYVHTFPLNNITFPLAFAMCALSWQIFNGFI